MKTLASYKASFFYIDMQSEKDLNISNLLNNSNFLHEYIHFIQDVTTVYGFKNMSVIHQDLGHAIHQAYKSKNKLFSIPFSPINDGILNFYRLYNYASAEENSTIDIINKIENISIDKEEFGSRQDKISVVNLSIYDTNDIQHHVGFGAFCIQEYMANFLECILSGKNTFPAQYPYKLAEIVVDNIYPKFAENKFNIFALCDLALLTDNPGVAFIRFLNEYKSKEWLPNTPEEIYDIFYQSNWGAQNQPESLAQLIATSAVEARDSLLRYFNDYTYFADIRLWIMKVICNSLELRLSNKYFMLDIAKNGLATENEHLFMMLDKVGVPNVVNNNGDCISCLGGEKTELTLFLAISQMYSLFYQDNNYYKCILCKICLRKQVISEAECEYPWLRELNSKKLCPFSTLWKHWKLEGYMPVPE